MEFSKEECKVIYETFNVCINAINLKKHHKSKNDILVLNQLQEINEKINKYLEV